MDNLTLNSPFSYQTNNVGDIKYFIKNNNNYFLNNKTNYNYQIYLIFIKTKRINKIIYLFFKYYKNISYLLILFNHIAL